jgi:uncharacterized protein YbjQ (UPF0145 family)
VTHDDTSQAAPQDAASIGVPEDAMKRLAEMKPGQATSLFTSDLSVNEFLLVREAGFRPLGLVLGSSIYHVGFQMGKWSQNQELGTLTQAMYHARELAMTRMEAEADLLGADGIVGVRLDIEFKEFGNDLAEFIAVGTAVLADEPPATGDGWRPNTGKPFTSDLSGQDFAKLVSSGWMPAGLVLGITVAARHDDWRTVGQTRWSAGNAEVQGWTALVNDARHDSRQQLAADVQRIGGEGVVVASMDMRVRERECPAQEGGRDHIIEAVNIGTAIVRFKSKLSEQTKQSPLAIMSLDPKRRQAARVDIGQNR